jgi:hypothetical protein
MKFFLFIFISGLSLSQVQAGSTIESLGGAFTSAVQPVLKPGQKEAFVEYMNMLGVGLQVSNDMAWNTNVGLDAHFESQFATDACFRDKTKTFYEKISAYIRSRPSYKDFDETAPPKPGGCTGSAGHYGTNSMLKYDCPSSHSLTIDKKIGKGAFSEYESGWVLKLALETTGGNTREALNLIAACGHDDASAGFSYAKINPSLKKNILNCPPADSAFYVPGGLGNDVDIDENLKKDITAIQSKAYKDPIPGKYYHVYASAFLACHLVSNDFQKDVAVFTQKQAARAYRSITLCNSNSGLLQMKPQLEEIQTLAKKQNKRVEDYLFTKSDLLTKDCEKVAASDKGTCKFLQNTVGNEGRDSSETLERILNSLKEIDAATLYKNWFLGGKTLGINLPCTDARILGPENLMKGEETFEKALLQPSGWSDERYKNAKKTVRSWEIDFDWTIAQHEAGAKFAAKNCQKQAAKPNFCIKGEKSAVDTGVLKSPSAR